MMKGALSSESPLPAYLYPFMAESKPTPPTPAKQVRCAVLCSSVLCCAVLCCALLCCEECTLLCAAILAAKQSVGCVTFLTVKPM